MAARIRWARDIAVGTVPVRLPTGGNPAHAGAPHRLDCRGFPGSASGSLRRFRRRGVAQLGSALRSGRRGRRFKSGHPDQETAGHRVFGGLRFAFCSSRCPVLGAEWEPILSHEEVRAMSASDDSDRARKVFVVHGRNRKARTAMFTFLRAIGLAPIEWSEAVKLTGEASPYIGNVLDAAFNAAQAVVVLLTPDDI